MSNDRDRIAADYRFLFKAIQGVRNGGCHVAIWLPDGFIPERPLPLAMMSHGGAWTVGALDGIPYNQVRYFLKHGIAVGSFEYRHLPHASLTDVREDLLDAYLYVQGKISADLEEAGSQARIDGSRCAFMGWSAGGTNTLLVGHDVSQYITSGKSPKLPRLRALISTYPLARFASETEPRIPFEEGLSKYPDFRLAYETLMPQECNTVFKSTEVQTQPGKASRAIVDGETAKQKPASARRVFADIGVSSGCLVSRLLRQDPPYAEKDALDLIDPSYPPTCVVVASEDKLIPTKQSYDTYERLQHHGVDSLLVVCEGMAHGQAEGLPGSPWQDRWWDEALRPSLDFAISRMKA